MGRTAKREQLSRALESHAQTIKETFQMFEEAASSSAEKIDFSQVIKMADDVSKQATIAGMLWSGETHNMGELEENIAVFCNVLQGFLLLSHSSTVGAGNTLLACVRESVMQVTECSLALLRGAVSSYGIPGKKSSIPPLSGAVWKACDALKKTPTSNSVAIGRAITRAAVSIKDVLRELGELKLANSDDGNKSNQASETCEEDGLSDDDFGNDLSPEEMKNAQMITSVVSDTLTVIKELMHFITGLLKGRNSDGGAEKHVDTLERVLKFCQDFGSQIDELGACVYPPQEVQQIKAIASAMTDNVEHMKMLIINMIESSDEVLNGSLDQLKSSLKVLQCGVVSVDSELVDGDLMLSAEIENLDLLT